MTEHHQHKRYDDGRGRYSQREDDYVQEHHRHKNYDEEAPPPRDAARQPPMRRRQDSEESYDHRHFTSSFDTKEIRHRFIRRVYTLLFIMLAFTTGVIGLFVFEEHVNDFARKNPFVGIGFYIGFFILYILLACVQKLRKSFPLNAVLLCLFTLITSVAFAFIAATYSPDIVLYSAGITAAACLLITLLACQPWIDITGWGKILCIMMILVATFGLVVVILGVIMGFNKILYLIYASAMAVLLCMYFLYTTQLIIGGKKHEMSPEEYVLGTITLYVEVLLLFTTILGIFGAARS